MASLPRISLKTPPASPVLTPITLVPSSPGQDRIILERLDDDLIISPSKHSRNVINTSSLRIGGIKRRKIDTSHLGSMSSNSIAGSRVTSSNPSASNAENNSTADDIDYIDSAANDFTVEEQNGSIENLGYSEYMDSVLEDGTAFFQISKTLFVVNGWDSKKMCSKVIFLLAGWEDHNSNFIQDTWYHVQRLSIGSEIIHVCTCPATKDSNRSSCVHEFLLKEHGMELFPEDGALPGKSPF